MLHLAFIRTVNLAVNHPLLPQWESTVFGPLAKNSFHKVLVSSALLEPSAAKLLTTSNAVPMEMTLLLVLPTHCAKFNLQHNGILNISLANHTLMEVILLTLLQQLPTTTALASLATINA